ncbi:sugar efflux transporter [mine drainage metagenome]|uniref:Sugar efflux transporter n=1 Tax=mine drainage metagenome TaxID=410659 RepID=A0A1J5Q3G9_9ZZZZ
MIALWQHLLPRFAATDSRRLQLASFVSVFDRFTMPPMLIAIAHDLHVPLTQIVGAASIYFLIYGLMQPIWGMLSNRIGLAATIRWCTLAGSLAALAAVWANDVTTLTISRAIAGGFFSASFPAALIYVGETSTPKRRHREITDLMTAVALATALSTAVSGSLTAFVGWRWGFALSAALGIASSFYLAHLKELPRTSFRAPIVTPLVTVLRSRAVQKLLLLALLDGAAILGALTFIPAALESAGHNAAVASGITATYGFSVLAGARMVGKLSNRIARAHFILAGSVSGALACLLLSTSTRLPVAVVACFLLGLAWASMHSSLQTWATEVLPEQRPIAVSFFAGTLFAGSALASALGGPLAQHHQFGALFLRGTGLLLVLGIAGTLTRKKWESRNFSATDLK